MRGCAADSRGVGDKLGLPHQFWLWLQSEVPLAGPVGWLAQSFCKISTALDQATF